MDFRKLRQELIVFQNTIKLLRPSRQLSLSNTNLETAMMWCGTYMKFAKLGDNPYAKHDGNRKSVKDIEPMFDATDVTLSADIMNQGHVYVIDQLRELLSKDIEGLVEFMSNEDNMGEFEANMSASDVINTNLSLVNLYTYLTQARMYLGMELGRCREEGVNPPEVTL